MSLASSVEMCTDHGAEYMEKPDQTDSEAHEWGEKAGTEKPTRCAGQEKQAYIRE